MSAVERHGNQVSLHSFCQGANLTIKSQRPGAAERGCEEGISGTDFSLWRTRVTTQTEVRATHARQQRRKARFFENVAVVVAGNRIATEAKIQIRVEKPGERRSPMAQLRIRLGTMRDACARAAHRLNIRVVDSYAMGKQWPRLQNAVPGQILDRR